MRVRKILLNIVVLGAIAMTAVACCQAASAQYHMFMFSQASPDGNAYQYGPYGQYLAYPPGPMRYGGYPYVPYGYGVCYDPSWPTVRPYDSLRKYVPYVRPIYGVQVNAGRGYVRVPKGVPHRR